MRAALLSDPGALDAVRIARVDVPSPGPDEVLVRVSACGVCGHDLADRDGLLRPPLPTVLGHEVAGTVVVMGDAVTGLREGDRVAAKQYSSCGVCLACRSGDEVHCPGHRFNYGGFAEYAVLAASSLLRIPDGVDAREASVVACAVGTGLQALRDVARVQPGETVLVTGAGGGLGLHGVQVAAALGARVLAQTRDVERSETLRSLGAEVVLATGEQSWRDVLDATDGRGADIVLDNVGHPRVFGPAFRALATRGRYVFTGQVADDPLRFHPSFVLGKGAVITGSASTTTATFADAMSLVADGAVRAVVTPYPLCDVRTALADLAAGRVTGRAVLVPGNGS